ncbi:hypothetical protein [Primorskyibacter marinus]|uniref:hypothetical protein n=1 Tax=Primorskyibacter marinus TaxID=1977320 RepID=UPI001300B4D6|nr:hypothetical protein [Primorskyibacter marinus]
MPIKLVRSGQFSSESEEFIRAITQLWVAQEGDPSRFGHQTKREGQNTIGARRPKVDLQLRHAGAAPLCSNGLAPKDGNSISEAETLLPAGAERIRFEKQLPPQASEVI